MPTWPGRSASLLGGLLINEGISVLNGMTSEWTRTTIGDWIVLFGSVTWYVVRCTLHEWTVAVLPPFPRRRLGHVPHVVRSRFIFVCCCDCDMIIDTICEIASAIELNSNMAQPHGQPQAMPRVSDLFAILAKSFAFAMITSACRPCQACWLLTFAVAVVAVAVRGNIATFSGRLQKCSLMSQKFIAGILVCALCPTWTINHNAG